MKTFDTTDNRLVINAAHIQEKGIELQGVLSSKIFEINDNDRILAGRPLEFDLKVSLVQKSILVLGKVKTAFKCRCDRCLALFELPLENEGVCHYVDLPGDRIIDLTEKIREDILIMFPQKCLCSAQCKGICSACGQNLNLRHCSCADKVGTNAIWDRLDELDL